MAGNDQQEDQAQLSARIVEEGYVTLQERMHTYRQARNQGNRAAGLGPDEDPVIILQDAVETFFSLIRPYIEDEPRLREYWRGALAQHPDQHLTRERAFAYYDEHSTGVWQKQPHVFQVPQRLQQQPADGDAAAATDGGQPDPADWHEMLGLSDSVRVLGVSQGYYVEGRFSVLGLRNIKRWEVRTHRERQSGNGFMAGETATRETREPEPAKKVETAAEMLVDVADELNAIASYEPSGDRIHGTPVPDE